MKDREARDAALARACGVLQGYLDEGSLYDAYSDLPLADIAKIEKHLHAIIDALARRIGERKMERRGIAG